MNPNIISSNIRFTHELHAEMHRIAKRKKISLAAAVRESCEAYIRENTNPAIVPEPIEEAKSRGIFSFFNRLKQWRLS